MPAMCLITTCMGRLAHLQQTLKFAADQSDCSCVVVDYSCPEHCGDWVERHFPAVKVVRVPRQTHFSASRARNRGAAAADAPWLCFFDADVFLKPDFSRHMLTLLQDKTFYLVRPFEKELCGTVICQRSDFVAVGGYDEVFQGWGEQDVDFYAHLQLQGVAQKEIPRTWVDVIHHDDTLRGRHGNQSMFATQTGNRLYSIAKFDLMRLYNRKLSLDERTQLYGEAGQSVKLWLQNNQSTQWRITYQQEHAIFGQEITSTLVYTLQPLPQNRFVATESSAET